MGLRTKCPLSAYFELERFESPRLHYPPKCVGLRNSLTSLFIINGFRKIRVSQSEACQRRRESRVILPV